jgi:hypothetical protein
MAMTGAQAQLMLRTNDFRDILPELVRCVQESRVTPRLIRIEGVMGVGKSALAQMIADALTTSVIHVEREFAHPDKSDRPYAEAINLTAFRAHLASLLQKSTWTIVEAVCLSEVAPEKQFGRGFVIYLKRLAIAGPDVHLWHGFNEDYLNIDDRTPLLSRSIHEYHKQFRPHEKANVLILLPEQDHSFADRPPRS